MFLTGKNDKESIMNAVNLKPVDYILKTIDKPCLLAKESSMSSLPVTKPMSFVLHFEMTCFAIVYIRSLLSGIML